MSTQALNDQCEEVRLTMNMVAAAAQLMTLAVMQRDTAEEAMAQFKDNFVLSSKIAALAAAVTSYFDVNEKDAVEWLEEIQSGYRQVSDIDELQVLITGSLNRVMELVEANPEAIESIGRTLLALKERGHI